MNIQAYNKAIVAGVAVVVILVLQAQGVEVSQSVLDEILLGIAATFGVYQVPNE